MNRWASAVSTTCTSCWALVRRLAISTALCAAIEPVTPRTMFFPMLISVAREIFGPFRQIGRYAFLRESLLRVFGQLAALTSQARFVQRAELPLKRLLIGVSADFVIATHKQEAGREIGAFFRLR